MGHSFNQDTEELMQALLKLKNIDEARMFLTDLLTETELLEFSKRWKTARMLAAGVPYSQIVTSTGLSTTTVARISRWLSGGAGGYRLMLKRFSSKQDLLSNKKSSLQKRKTKPIPLHSRGQKHS